MLSNQLITPTHLSSVCDPMRLFREGAQRMGSALPTHVNGLVSRPPRVSSHLASLVGLDGDVS